MNPEKIKHVLYRMGVVPIDEASDALKLTGTKVFVDGCLIGYTNKPLEIVDEFRAKRRRNEIPSMVSIAYYSKLYGQREEIYVCLLYTSPSPRD